jgi:small subunit ribosomal protein S15
MDMGKSTTAKPVWLKMNEEELKKIIAELAEKYDAPQIGLVLRDQYGIPSTRVYGKKLSVYLKEINKLSSPELKNIEKKTEKLRKHLANNVTDKKAKHKLQKAESRMNKTRKYFKKTNKK